MKDEVIITELDFGLIGIPKRWSFGDKTVEIEKKLGKLEHIIKCKIHGYLIHIDEKLVLLDTGLHLDVIKNPLESLGADIYKDFPVYCDESNFLINQIKKKGHSLKDIDYVLISHLHFDHAGALESILNSKLIMAPEIMNLMMQNKTNKLVDEDGNQIIPRSVYQKFKEKNRIIPIEKPYFDLFDDGRFILLRTDGHVEGHFSAVIFTYRDSSKNIFNQIIYEHLAAANKNLVETTKLIGDFEHNILKCDIFPFDAVFSELHHQFEIVSKSSCWNLDSAMKSLKLIKKIGDLPNSKIYFPHPLCKD